MERIDLIGTEAEPFEFLKDVGEEQDVHRKIQHEILLQRFHAEFLVGGLGTFVFTVGDAFAS